MNSYLATGKTCKELKDGGASSGVYTINPDDGEPFEVSNMQKIEFQCKKALSA